MQKVLTEIDNFYLWVFIFGIFKSRDWNRYAILQGLHLEDDLRPITRSYSKCIWFKSSGINHDFYILYPAAFTFGHEIHHIFP